MRCVNKNEVMLVDYYRQYFRLRLQKTLENFCLEQNLNVTHLEELLKQTANENSWASVTNDQTAVLRKLFLILPSNLINSFPTG